MRNKTKIYLDNSYFYEFLIKSINYIDSLRAQSLQYILRIKRLKSIYLSRDKRIFSSYLFISFLSMALSVMRPDLLLVLGPLIYGYWHLISSYKYSSFLSPSIDKNSKAQRYILYGLLTVTFLEISIRLYIRYFNSSILLPNGFIGLSISILYFFILFVCYGSVKKLIHFLIFFGASLSVALLAWNEPLNFVSITLFGHNWIAFIFWIKFSRDKKSLMISIFSLFVFSLFHLLVIYGVFDNFFFLFEDHFLAKSGYQRFAWILAPWSDDSIVWRRALCLYTFGLSVHYFIWLRAIPENLCKNKTPVSFKRSFLSLKNGYGLITSYFLILISIFGTVLWLMWFELGTLIYFSISNIHVWTEFVLLFFSFSIFRKG